MKLTPQQAAEYRGNCFMSRCGSAAHLVWPFILGASSEVFRPS